MIKKFWILITILSVNLGCQKQTEHASENSIEEIPDTATGYVDRKIELQDDQQAGSKTVTLRLTSGLYRGGLRLAIHDNVVSGYYEDASGWNEQVGAPQFSCEYFFIGEYTGSDTIPLTLPADKGTTGKLELLNKEKIRVSLSSNPCDNEQSTTETWEIESAYPLMAIKKITSAKSYFYSHPREESRLRSYLVKGDRAEVTGIEGEWHHVLYRGEKSTTEGWMPALAFDDKEPSNSVLGTWLSKAGERYEVYYQFYSNSRYKTWGMNSLKPQGMTGSFATVESGIISLNPCGGAAATMPFRDAGSNEISLKIPGTDTWTVFEKHSGDLQGEGAGFSIEKREIITTVNGRVVRIPSRTKKGEFLNAVCPFEVTPDVINRGEGTFDILRVSTLKNGPLFYAILDGDEVTALVIERQHVQRQGITVGSTFGELKRAIPSVAINRSEIEGKVVGSNEHFTFSFGYLSSQLFDATSKSIPDSVKIRQIIL